jgi:hypothetical protein
METIETYFERKAGELSLLNECLRRPLSLAKPTSVSEVISQKFQLTAALKGEHVRGDWTGTETAWADVQHRNGSFEFTYDYQRADLDVAGPAIYQLEGLRNTRTIYTGSGMAAIAALLLASAKLMDRANILVLPGSYGETQELIEGYARQLHMVTNPSDLHVTPGDHVPYRIMLIDSSLPAYFFEALICDKKPNTSLVIFDTTCFSASSGRVRRVVNWAKRAEIPLVMVRSHNKLDSLGAEYGRLGSLVFTDWGSSKLEALPDETRNAMRLLGGAALPAHFPPYVGKPTYRDLTNQRIAAILRNSRRASRYFATALPDLVAELRYVHGLYITLNSAETLSEETARQLAAAMSEDLQQMGFPIRHAGSFGFDFAATEWFRDRIKDEYVIRVAVPDLPTALWDKLSDAIARWWLDQERRLLKTKQRPTRLVDRPSGPDAGLRDRGALSIIH